jgi:hypothetical protein
MPDRDPRIDPTSGDELAGGTWRYRVIWHECGCVRYDLLNKNWGYVASQSVSLSGWRDMAAGLKVEKVA